MTVGSVIFDIVIYLLGYVFNEGHIGWNTFVALLIAIAIATICLILIAKYGKRMHTPNKSERWEDNRQVTIEELNINLRIIKFTRKRLTQR